MNKDLLIGLFAGAVLGFALSKGCCKKQTTPFNKDEAINKIKQVVKTFPDFPKKGVNFVDYFSICYHSKMHDLLVKVAIAHLDKQINKGMERPTHIVGLETRGFMLGIQLSSHYGIPFVPIRKKGKLPGELLSVTYSLEYGTDTAEIQKSSLKKGDSVLIVDDLLATGGTMKGAEQLVLQCGADLTGYLVIFELLGLKGREKLEYQARLMTLITDLD